jgi:hypothetical protein
LRSRSSDRSMSENTGCCPEPIGPEYNDAWDWHDYDVARRELLREQCEEAKEDERRPREGRRS